MTFRSYGASFYLSALALSTSSATETIYLCELATRTDHFGRLTLLGIATRYSGAGGGESEFRPPLIPHNLLILQDGRNYKNIRIHGSEVHAGYTDDAVEARASQVVASRSETAAKR
jgi:hypothetical protein